MKKQKIIRRLEKVQTEESFVRIKRHGIETGDICGYVVALGPKHYLIEVLEDDIRLAGFACLAYADTTHCKQDGRAEFYRRVLRLRKVERQPHPAIDLTSIRSLLESSSKCAPAIAVFREHKSPDTCRIGRVESYDEKTAHMRDISLKGKWATNVTRFRMKDVTRVDFGGGYEDALILSANALAKGKSNTQFS